MCVYICPDEFEDSTAGTVMNAYMQRIGKFWICIAEKDYYIYVLFYHSCMRDFLLKVSKLSEKGVNLMFHQDHNKTFYEHGIRHQINLGNWNTTIAQYCPNEGNINDFKFGVPVFMSSKVYKRLDNEWIASTTTDRTDCISSVQLNGNHKTYVGVCVEIDLDNNSITFGSHGDFMFNVENSSLHEVGDVILYDGRILEDDLTVTSLLLQSVVGKITSIIDDYTVSVFKD